MTTMDDDSGDDARDATNPSLFRRLTFLGRDVCRTIAVSWRQHCCSGSSKLGSYFDEAVDSAMPPVVVVEASSSSSGLNKAVDHVPSPMKSKTLGLGFSRDIGRARWPPSMQNSYPNIGRA